MNNQFVPFETAKKLKELGFDEESVSEGMYSAEGKFIGMKLKNYSFMSTIHAPLWQQVEEWLWEEHRIFLSLGLTHFSVYDYKKENGTCEVYFKAGLEENPIQAKQEGIKAAVNHLYKKK